MFRYILYCWLLCSGVSPALAQPLVGYVYDATTGEPLPGANVLLAHSTKGTSTNLDGQFQIKGISEGPHDLVVRFVGYHATTVSFRWPSQQPLKVELVPRTEELAGVTISAQRDFGWRLRLRMFQEALFGPTDNAKRCKIQNPEVIEITMSEGVLNATTQETITIENLALGYRVSLQLEHLRQEGSTLSYKGLPFFEPLTPENEREQQRWDRAREKAYRGSRRHFLQAMAANRLGAEGFEVYAITWDNINESWRPLKKMSFDDLLTVSERGHYELNAAFSWQIIYTEEPTPELLVGQNRIPYRPYQVSYFHFQASTITMTVGGTLHRPEQVTDAGYWFFERVADLLPEEYTLIQPLEEVPEQEAPTKNGFALTNLLLPIAEILPGGPPRDGIPALTAPDMLTAEEATYLEDSDRVLALYRHGEAKAYPIKIMDFHEVVNDRIGEEPIVITYCPLCGSGIAFQRTVRSETLAFGVSGLLYQSDVLLYDRQSESLWSQLEMKAIAGPKSGEQLSSIPLQLTTWGDWKERYPRTSVLSDQTGHQRNYETSAYAGYSETEQLYFPVQYESDILDRKAQVLGVRVGDQYRAYPYAFLSTIEEPLVQTLGEESFTIHFNADQNTVRVEGSNQVEYLSLYWFAWYTFHPKTEVWQP